MRCGAMTRSRRPTRSRCSSQTCVASSRPTARSGCCTPSGEPATSFAPRLPGALRRASLNLSASFDRLPIRMRLAGVSALLTFVILCAFAVAIGSLTVHRIRDDFNRQVSDTARQLPSHLKISGPTLGISPPLPDVSSAEDRVIKVVTEAGGILAQDPKHAPYLGPLSTQPATVNGY